MYVLTHNLSQVDLSAAWTARAAALPGVRRSGRHDAGFLELRLGKVLPRSPSREPVHNLLLRSGLRPELIGSAKDSVCP